MCLKPVKADQSPNKSWGIMHFARRVVQSMAVCPEDRSIRLHNHLQAMNGFTPRRKNTVQTRADLRRFAAPEAEAVALHRRHVRVNLEEIGVRRFVARLAQIGPDFLEDAWV